MSVHRPARWSKVSDAKGRGPATKHVGGSGAGPNPPVEAGRVGVEKRALSLGERVSGDGAFSSRRRTGEGFIPFALHLGWLEIRISY